MSQTLLDFFSEVFAYVVDVRNKASEGEHVAYGEVVSDISSLLEKAELANKVEAGMVGEIKTLRYPEEYFDLAKFAVIAYIDEGLISSNWVGRSDWAKDLLQKKIYNSIMAGSQFFDKLEKLRDLASKDERDTLEVFFNAIVLGFEGIYYETPEKLAEMSRNFHTKISRFDSIYQTTLLPSYPEEPDKSKFREFVLNRTTFFILYTGAVVGSIAFSFWWYAGDLSTAVELILQIYKN